MAQLPPWLNIGPTDFLRAVAEGTQAGQAAANAAQRQWEQEQQMRLEAQRLQQSQAERATEAQGLQLWREAQLKAREQAQEGIQQRAEESRRIREQGLAQSGALQKLGLDLRERGLTDTEERNKTAAENAADRLKVQQQIADMRERGFEDPVQKALLGADVTDLKALEKKRSAAEDRGSLYKLIHPGEVSDLQKQEQSLRSQIQSRYGKIVQQPQQTNKADLAARAHAAIAAHADDKAVRERYKKLTGEDLD